MLLRKRGAEALEESPPDAALEVGDVGSVDGVDDRAPAENLVNLGHTFKALSVPAYRYLWLSMIAGFFGMQMQQVARGYLAYRLGGTASSIAIVTLAWGLPLLLFSLVGGAIADRVDRRRLIIVSQALSVVLAAVVAVLVQTGYISLLILFISGVVQGSIFALNGPARQAFIPEVVGEDQFMNAIALNMAGMNVARIAGPSLAGALIAVPHIDIQGVYYIQAVLNAVALVLLIMMPRVATRVRAGEGAGASGSIKSDLLAGLRYVLHSPILRTLLLIGVIPSLIGLAYQTFLPVLAQDVFGHGEPNAGGLGLLMTVSGVGAVLGSLAVAATADYPRRIRLQLFAGLGFGICLAAFSVQHELLLALIPLVGVGFMSDYFASINSTILMSATDPEYYGRVQSVGFAMFALTPIGTLPLGLLADTIGNVSVGPVNLIGVQVTLFLAGIVIVAFMLAIHAFGRRYAQTEQKDLKRFAVVAAERMAAD